MTRVLCLILFAKAAFFFLVKPAVAVDESKGLLVLPQRDKSQLANVNLQNKQTKKTKKKTKEKRKKERWCQS